MALFFIHGGSFWAPKLVANSAPAVCCAVTYVAEDGIPPKGPIPNTLSQNLCAWCLDPLLLSMNLNPKLPGLSELRCQMDGKRVPNLSLVPGKEVKLLHSRYQL